MKLLKVYKQEIFNIKRNFGLDIIRSVAILLVLFAHLGIPDEATGGIMIGGLGVEIFFVLSGFLIGQILIKEFSISLSGRSIMRFWIRRWLRTLPLYYLVILIKFILVDHSLGYKILVYFFFLQNNFVGIDFMPVTWSLVVEEWFYLTLPILLYVFFHKRVMSSKGLIFFIICFIFFENILRFSFVAATNRPYGAISGNFPFRLDSMMCGVLLAALKLNYNSIYGKLASVRVFICVFIVYALLMYFWFGQTNLIPGELNKSLSLKTIWFFINSFCIALLIPFVEEKVKVKSTSNFFRVLFSSISIFSYCAYLIHMEIFSRVLSSETFTSMWYIESGFCFLITFFLSALVYGIYEKPMTDLRDHFKEKQSPKVIYERL